jgi:acyl-CoA thioesterase FadM
MNLFVRLLKVILLAFLRPGKLPPLGVSVLHFRVWPNDLDTNLHMNNGRYMTLLDLGRFDLLLRAGVFAIGWRRNWNPVLGSASIRFRRSLKLFESFTMRTRLIGWDSTWIYLEQTIESKNKLVTLAYLRGMFTCPKGRVPMAEILAALGAQEMPSPELPEGLRLWLKGEESLYASLKSDPLEPQVATPKA